MRLKRTKNRQIMPHYIQIADLDELRWIYGTISKIGQN